MNITKKFKMVEEDSNCFYNFDKELEPQPVVSSVSRISIK